MPDPMQLIYVGTVTDKNCTVLSNKHNIVAIPLGFTVSPLEAAKAALRDKSMGCLLKTGYGIYADKANYYIVNNNLVLFKSKNASNLKLAAVAVNGKSGKVVESR